MGNTDSQAHVKEEKNKNNSSDIISPIRRFETEPSKSPRVRERKNDNQEKPTENGKKGSSITAADMVQKNSTTQLQTMSSVSPAASSTKLGNSSSNIDISRTASNKKSSSKKNIERRDDVLSRRKSIIKDDQVLVNLAMADLMAYLQVVANNSNNLPLTRRDDPELTRMVTDITSEEYAKKSAAFIPADVRVIGGSFLKYGNVWDLPTSEEYIASDGAQEPGRSYGGACSNSMLKVLYDAASEAADAAQNDEAADNLFDDDDDESLATFAPFTRNSTFASLDMNDQSNPSIITWADLLRKMKNEINDIEYVQAPTISSTRKFDLNTPFSLVPESFDKSSGKKRSLLIGCNYHGTEGAELKASHDDVRSMKDYIVNVHGFSETDDMMTILLDDKEHKSPTFTNIVEAFKSLSEQSQPGDSVFVQFSGHGGRILDSPINNDVESYDEIIAPSDYNRSGIIRDTLIYKTLLAPMRYGVHVTVIIDCCDTGMMLDLPYSWSTRSDRPDSVAKMTQCDDFSFVRFLKVVKTLYESSTFTQLGRTVGTALGQQDVLLDYSDEEEGTLCTTDSRVIDRSRTEDMQQGFMCSPRSAGILGKSSKNNINKGCEYDRDALNFIEKMLGCNFLIHDMDDGFVSDEETCANNTFEEEQTIIASTFDSISDDEYNKRSTRRKSSRRNR